MLSRTNLADPLPHSPLNHRSFKNLPPLEISCPSFSGSYRLFSTTCSLFSQNARGGVHVLAGHLWNQQHTASFFSLPLQLSYYPPYAPRWQSNLHALCFHNFTNPFSLNSFPFISIQNSGGAPQPNPARQLSDTILSLCPRRQRATAQPNRPAGSQSNHERCNRDA